MIEQTLNNINNLVLKGILPVSFYNSKIIDLTSYCNGDYNIEYFNNKYQQRSVLRHISGQMICKIFEI